MEQGQLLFKKERETVTEISFHTQVCVSTRECT